MIKSGYISLVVVEDDPLFRESVREMITTEPGMLCLGDFADIATFMAAFDTLDADIYWIDINLPDGSGASLIKHIKQHKPGALCIVCSLHDDDDHIFEALKSGADGYMLKNAPVEKMTDGIHELYAGGSPMSAAIARKVMTSFHEFKPMEVASIDTLTQREKEVLEHLAKGLLYKEVGVKLDISTETVKKHLRSIYRKLQVKNRTEAVVKYLVHNK